MTDAEQASQLLKLLYLDVLVLATHTGLIDCAVDAFVRALL
jgi:hypothetical protein